MDKRCVRACAHLGEALASALAEAHALASLAATHFARHDDLCHRIKKVSKLWNRNNGNGNCCSGITRVVSLLKRNWFQRLTMFVVVSGENKIWIETDNVRVWKFNRLGRTVWNAWNWWRIWNLVNRKLHLVPSAASNAHKDDYRKPNYWSSHGNEPVLSNIDLVVETINFRNAQCGLFQWIQCMWCWIYII